MSDEERYPIVRELLAQSYGTILEKRACYAVCRFVERERRAFGPHYYYSRQRDAMEHLQSQIRKLNYEQFLAELTKPDGGLIAQVPGIGKDGLAILRRRCLLTTTEYGYA